MTHSRTEPIRAVRFEGTKSGIKSAARAAGMMDIAQAEAEAWLAEYGDAIEIVSISTALGDMSAMVTVWYR